MLLLHEQVVSAVKIIIAQAKKAPDQPDQQDTKGAIQIQEQSVRQLRHKYKASALKIRGLFDHDRGHRNFGLKCQVDNGLLSQ